MYKVPKAGQEQGCGTVTKRLINLNLHRLYLQSEKDSETEYQNVWIWLKII